MSENQESKPATSETLAAWLVTFACTSALGLGILVDIAAGSLALMVAATILSVVALAISIWRKEREGERNGRLPAHRRVGKALEEKEKKCG